MNLTTEVRGKLWNTEKILDLLTQGESAIDPIDILLEKKYGELDLSMFSFQLRAVSDEFDSVCEQILTVDTTKEMLRLTWEVTREFTAVPGYLHLSIFVTDPQGERIMVITSPLGCRIRKVETGSYAPPDYPIEKVLAQVLENAEKAQIAAIESAQCSAKLVEEVVPNAIGLVQAKGAEQIEQIEHQGLDHVETIQREGSAWLSSIESLSSLAQENFDKFVEYSVPTATNLVSAEGAKQVGLVNAAGVAVTSAAAEFTGETVPGMSAALETMVENYAGWTRTEADVKFERAEQVEASAEGEALILGTEESYLNCLEVYGRTTALEQIPTPAQPVSIGGVSGVEIVSSEKNLANRSQRVEITPQRALHSLPDGTRDSVNLAIGRVKYATKRLELDGTEPWIEAPAGNYYYVKAQDLPQQPITNSQVLCSHFINSTSNGIYIGTNLAITKAALPQTAQTLANMKAYLAAQKAAGAPVTVLYALAQPVEEALPADQALKLKGGIRTYGGGTSLSVTASPPTAGQLEFRFGYSVSREDQSKSVQKECDARYLPCGSAHGNPVVLTGVQPKSTLRELKILGAGEQRAYVKTGQSTQNGMPTLDSPVAIVSSVPAGTYKVNTKWGLYEVDLAEPLDGIGGAKDRLALDALTGRAYVQKRINRLTLDGTEPWTYLKVEAQDFYQLHFKNAGHPNAKAPGNSGRDYSMCDRVPWGYVNTTSNTYNVWGDAGEGMNINLDKSLLAGWSEALTSVEKAALFKGWLAAHPAVVAYEMAAAIDTLITLRKVQSSAAPELEAEYIDLTPSPDNPVPVAGTGESGSISLELTGGAGESRGMTIALEQPLYGLKNADGTWLARDSIERVNGEWSIVRRVHKALMTEQLPWGYTTISVHELFQIGFETNKIPLASIFLNRGENAVSDRLPFGNVHTTPGTFELWSSGKGLNINPVKAGLPGWSGSLTSAEKLAVFKTWLRTHPLTIWYELAEPVVEPLPYNTRQELERLEPYAPECTLTVTDPVLPEITVEYNKLTGSEVAVLGNGLTELSARVGTLERDYAKIHGVRWAAGSSACAGERTHDATSLTAQEGVGEETVQNDFDKIWPWAGRRRCNGYRDESGEFVVTAYAGEPGYAANDPTKLVYVETPLFYYFDGIDTDGYEKKLISMYPVPGFQPSPACIAKDGSLRQHSYSAAYLIAMEGAAGSEKPTSRAGVYSDYASLNGWAANTKKLGTQYTIERMANWYVEELLMYVEFATKDVQSVMYGCATLPYADHLSLMVENGVNRICIAKTQAAAYVLGQAISLSNVNYYFDELTKNRAITKIEDKSPTEAYLYFNGAAVDIKATTHVSSRPWHNGATDVVKASSGSIVSNTSGKYPCVYRGRENPYGNVWQNIGDVLAGREGAEGDYRYFMAFLPDATKYANGAITSDYVKLSYDMATADGYVKEFGVDDKYPWARFATVVGGSSNTYYPDWSAYTRGIVGAVIAGGYLSQGANVGPGNRRCHDAPSHSGWDRRARLG